MRAFSATAAGRSVLVAASLARSTAVVLSGRPGSIAAGLAERLPALGCKVASQTGKAARLLFFWLEPTRAAFLARVGTVDALGTVRARKAGRLAGLTSVETRGTEFTIGGARLIGGFPWFAVFTLH